MKGIIIIHPRDDITYAINFDVLIKTRFSKYYLRKFKDIGYPINCGYVKIFLKENPDYIYVFSEDLLHIPEINDSIIDYLSSLKFDIKIMTHHRVRPENEIIAEVVM